MKHHYPLTVMALWISIVGVSAVWNIWQIEATQQQINLRVSRAFFELIVTVRKWNALHGGVYVPVSEVIQPNPYLDDPDRDIHLPDGKTLTKINPAYMTRLIGELAQKGNQVRFHITSLKPINPSNGADPWETEALRAFEARTEAEVFSWNGQSQIFSYMAPLVTDQSCLKCHGTQGYEVGDIRGGISVTFHAEPVNIWPIGLSHALIALAGLAGIGAAGRQLQAAFASLERQSQIDGLTQLYNRSYFDMYLQREFLRCRRQESPLSVILCDVDYFKPFNDIYGHQAGDRCLHTIADLLKRTIKRPSDLVARYGGEEFVIILPDTPSSGALVIAELIRANIEALCISHRGSQVSDYVTMSLGVASYSDELKVSALLRRADQALYQAKQSGRNMVVGDMPARVV